MDRGEVADVIVEAPPQPASTAAREPRIRTAIAVIMTRFPRIDETFILREINELERHGQPVLVVPILRDEGRIVHEEAKPWVKRALYTPFLSLGVLRSNAIAFFRKPAAYLRLLLRLIAGTILRPSTLIRTLALFPKSVHLAVELPRRGIRHVHAHFASHATTAAYIIASLSDITYSFTVHGPDVFVHRMLLREKIEKAAFIRAISMFNKAFLCGLYPVLTEGKVEVVHCGVNPEVYADAAEESKRIVERKGIQILSVAALTPSRGFPFLIDACAKLAAEGLDFECRIVGDGSLHQTTEAWIAQKGLTGRVRLVGNLPQHQVARLMGETDVFVLPSIIAVDGQMDGIPISLMEAMAAGKPVIASSISGIPELVKHDVSGILVDSAYAGRLAQEIRRLAADPQLRERLGRAGQLKVQREFDIRQTAATMVALFDRRKRVNEVHGQTADRVRSLHWSRLNTVAVGIRRVHERADAFVAEVTISDGITQRDVIVRRPRDRGPDEASPLERARAEFEVLSTLRHTMKPESGYTVPRLLMFDEPNAALVIERSDGTSLERLVSEARTRSRVMRLAAAMRRAGAWLRTMQKHTRGDEDGRHVLTAVLLLAQQNLELAVAGDFALRIRRDAILERLRELEGRVAARACAVVRHHGNYVPENIFIGERHVDVIDFGNAREGLELEDIAQMLLALELRRPVPTARRAFLEGYGNSIDSDALQLFTMTAALQMLARGGAEGRERRVLRRVASSELRVASAVPSK